MRVKETCLEKKLERISSVEVKIGCFDRNGEYGHEGKYYYDFKKYYWYKPTTSNLDDVYSTMNEIEKHNIEFIMAHIEKSQSSQSYNSKFT